MTKPRKFKFIPLHTVEELNKLWAAFVLLKQNGRIAIPDYLSEGILAHFLNAKRIEGNGDLLLEDTIIEQKTSTSTQDGPATFSGLFHNDSKLYFVQFHESLDGRFTVYDVPNELVMKVIEPQMKRKPTAFKVQFKKLIRENDIQPIYEDVTIF